MLRSPCVSSELCGDVESLELGDAVEYTVSKGKGNKISAEKVTRVAAGKCHSITVHEQCFGKFIHTDTLVKAYKCQ